LLAAAVLLLANQFVGTNMHGWISALPLLLAGFSFALLQVRRRPSHPVLLRRLLLAGAFIAWGIDQLLPSGRVAVFLGDVVIAAYVLDLFWMGKEL
jgi:hypothetical protein